MGSRQSSFANGGAEENAFHSSQQVVVRRRSQESLPDIFDTAGSYTSVTVPEATVPSIRPLNMRSAAVIKNPATLRKLTVQLKESDVSPRIYHIAFRCSASVDFEVMVQYACIELSSTDAAVGLTYKSVHGYEEAPPDRRDAGSDIEYVTPYHNSLDLSKHSINELEYKDTASIVQPIIIQLRSMAEGGIRRSEISIAALVKKSKGSTTLKNASLLTQYDIRVIKQKFLYDGQAYDMQPVYGVAGMEKGINPQSFSDDWINGRECVVCLSGVRTTAVLPCRHMCLCSDCADIMRVHSSKCPICRQEVTSLLQLQVTDAQ